MNYIVTNKLQEKIKQLQNKKNVTNEEFLNALTYVRPFEEVKKLFYDLKAIDAELSTLHTMAQKSEVA